MTHIVGQEHEWDSKVYPINRNVFLGRGLDKWNECSFISQAFAQESNETEHAEQNHLLKVREMSKRLYSPGLEEALPENMGTNATSSLPYRKATDILTSRIPNNTAKHIVKAEG